MKIDQLPVEMLMKIFSLLPTYDEISVVNKVFYGIACRENGSKYCLRINKRKDSELLRRMQTSNRQISKVEIIVPKNDIDNYYSMHWQLPSIISVVESFSATIKVFYLANVNLNVHTFLQILSVIPYVEQLNLSGIRFDTENNASEQLRWNDDVKLTKLKSLSIAGCVDEFIEFFSHLPTGVLTELFIDNFLHPLDTLAAVLNRQTNIRKLTLGPIQGDVNVVTEVLEKLNLESIELLQYTNSYTVALILSKQTKLKSLTLSDRIVVNERVMLAIAGLLELEKLVLYVTMTPDESIVHIRNLKNLKDLTLNCPGDNGEAKLQALAQLDNTSIRKLKLDVNRLFSVADALAKSTPNLTELDFLPHRRMCCNQLNAIMKHFDFIEVLRIPINLAYNCIYFNPMLTDLEILGSGLVDEPWLTKFSAAYPNLKKLKLQVIGRWKDQGDAVKITSFLNALTKLESLTLKTPKLIVEGLENALSYKNNLKFVSLGVLKKFKQTDDLAKKLRKHFDVVAISGGCLTLAVNRYTLNRERFGIRM